MERLVTTSQAAEILGISLQGIHYRIKNKKLKSIKEGGKTYVYISQEYDKKTEEPQKEGIDTQQITALKDEQIVLLKKTIKWLRRQHQDEITRIEKNQNKIIEVFNSEIKLLQSAFNEMREIYKPQIEHKQKIEEDEIRGKKDKYVSLEDFTLYLKKHHKDTQDIKMIIINALKNRDSRFVYNKKIKKILIFNRDFSDLL